MANTQTQDAACPVGQLAHYTRFAIAGAVGGAICGVAAVVLSVIGLAHPDWILPPSMAAIVVGAALGIQGTFAADRGADAPMSKQRESQAVVATEWLGGIAGIVLGILAIVGISPAILVSVAMIVIGTALIVGSIASNSFHSLHTAKPSGHTSQFALLPDVTLAASGVQSLVGLAAVVLGIIALLDQEKYNITLNLVALMIVGAYVVLQSTEATRRMIHMRAHWITE